MKYVWASLGTTSRRLPGEKTKGFKTRHIRGYGCAVSFTYADDVTWSSAQSTYALDGKCFETSIVKL